MECRFCVARWGFLVKIQQPRLLFREKRSGGVYAPVQVQGCFEVDKSNLTLGDFASGKVD